MIKCTVLSFVDAINTHDVEQIYSLMADDHLFVDAYASEVYGKENMKESWIGYFKWFPDYHIEVSDILVDGSEVAIFGFASGTYHGLQTEDNRNYYRLPASWKVIVADNEKIKHWQVFCDSKIPFDIMVNADREILINRG